MQSNEHTGPEHNGHAFRPSNACSASRLDSKGGESFNVTGKRLRLLTVLTICALALGLIAPLHLHEARAQSDELTQREFDDLLDEAEEQDPVFGPEDGSLEHDPDIITLELAGVDVTNFVAFAEFVNPADGSDQLFDIGLQFRIATQNDEPINIQFIVLSTGDWGLGETGADEFLATGTYEDFGDREGDENDLTVIADDEWIHLAINGDYLGSVEVDYEISGDIAVGTAFLTESYIDGGETEYADFTIWSDESGSSSSKDDDDKDQKDDKDQRDPDGDKPSADGTRYEAEVFDFHFYYGDEWEIGEPSRTDNIEFVQLVGDLSVLQIVVGNIWDEQAQCVEALLGTVLTNLENNGITGDVSNETPEELDDHPFPGTWGAEYTLEPDSGVDFPETTIYVECGPADSNEYLVGVVQLVPSDAYDDEVAGREAIVETFNIDDDVAPEDDDEEDVRPTAVPDEDEDDDDRDAAEGTRYEADLYDFFATIPDGWEVTSSFVTDTDPHFEIINLGDENSVIQIILGPFSLAKLDECISTIVNITLSNFESAEITGELSDGVVDEIDGGTVSATFTFTPDDDFPVLTIYAQCGPSGLDSYAIGLTQWAPASTYDDSVDGREQLVDSFNQEEQPAPDPDDDDDDKPTRVADGGDNLTANVKEGEDGLRIYTSPTFGLTVGILPGFTVEEDSVQNGYDTLVVADSVGRATYSIFNSSNTPDGCLNSIENNLNNDASITRVEIATDEDGAPFRDSGDGYALFAVYLTFNNGLELGRLYACVGDQSINTMLVFAYETSADDFPDGLENAITMINMIGIEE